ncbi:hypothetical protein NicSoilC5_18420 [Arthrobacter sp. NicSoilC5]|nr:hypothetical protein NicSoilC5_18420 [Arthrobacter sp. NicSoilC5]
MVFPVPDLATNATTAPVAGCATPQAWSMVSSPALAMMAATVSRDVRFSASSSKEPAASWNVAAGWLAEVLQTEAVKRLPVAGSGGTGGS